MADAAREAMLLEMVQEFPGSPMGHFSLGRFFLEEGRLAEAQASLSEAVRLDPAYAAAWVSLGDAFARQGDEGQARQSWEAALRTPHGQKDQSLQADLEDRLRSLEGV